MIDGHNTLWPVNIVFHLSTGQSISYFQIFLLSTLEYWFATLTVSGHEQTKDHVEMGDI